MQTLPRNSFNGESPLVKIRRFVRKSSSQVFKVLQHPRQTLRFHTSRNWISETITYGVAWILWLLMGTLFYANFNFEGNYAKGFYYSVNVGYSIGWGVLNDNSTACKAFSVVYILIGAIFVSRWLVYLIEKTVEESNDSAAHKIIADNIRRTSKLKGILLELFIYIVINNSKLFVIYIWFLFVIFGTLSSCYIIGWSMIDGLYFSISSMSTGGLWGIPYSSPDYVFALVGLFASIGVPVMGMAMGNTAALIVEAKVFFAAEEEEEYRKWINIPKDDVDLLKLLNHENTEHEINQNEYIILKLIKTKKVKVETIRNICEEFSSLSSTSVSNSIHIQNLPASFFSKSKLSSTDELSFVKNIMLQGKVRNIDDDEDDNDIDDDV
jgi:hypothetical protein